MNWQMGAGGRQFVQLWVADSPKTFRSIFLPKLVWSLLWTGKRGSNKTLWRELGLLLQTTLKQVNNRQTYKSLKVKVLLWKRAILCVEQYRMQSTLSNKRLCERPIIGGNKQTNNNIYVSDSKQQTNNNIIIYAPDSKNYLVRLFLGLLVTLSVWSIPNRVQKRQHQNYKEHM